MAEKSAGLMEAINSRSWIARWGVRAWLFLGMAGVAWIGFWLYSATSSFLIPLIIATILGLLFTPVVDWLERLRVPRVAGAILVMIALLGIAVATVWIVAAGIFAQWDLIQSQVQAGLTALEAWLSQFNIPPEAIQQVTDSAQQGVSNFASGLASAVGSGIASTLSFLFGTFLGAFMLFYILTDWYGLKRWMGVHLPFSDDELGIGIVEDATSAVRQYFSGVTISGLIVAVVIGVGLWLLNVPLVASIALVTFLTAYIPYFGAIISAVFACLIALGSGGVPAALAVLVIILIAQNVIQTIVTNQIASDKLSIHPLAGLLATLAGGVFFGLLGGVLGTPMLAAASRTLRRISDYEADGSAALAPDAGSVPE